MGDCRSCPVTSSKAAMFTMIPSTVTAITTVTLLLVGLVVIP